MKVLILHDEVSSHARADEADALTQARVVANALCQLGHETATLAATLDLKYTIQRIQDAARDIVFNIVESLGGHGRLIHVIPGLLEAKGIPFTGAGSAAQLATSNKLIAKQLMRGAGIDTPHWLTMRDLASNARIARGRYIIKSVWEHASVGLDEDSVLEIEATSDARLRFRTVIESRLDQLGGEAFVESFIEGREFNIAMLANPDAPGNDPHVLPPAEIIFEGYDKSKPKVVGWRAKWDENSFEYSHTPRRFEFPVEDEALMNRLRQIAFDCWRLFELRGHARVDFRVDEAGQPWVLEVNTNPCLSPDAGFAAALDQAGVAFPEAVNRILSDIHKPSRSALVRS